jgi:pimeloyl-ACP methyl ester carboxylesterase
LGARVTDRARVDETAGSRVDPVAFDPVPVEHLLEAADGVPISAVHVPGAQDDLCLLVVHGFTGNWRADRVQKVIDSFVRFGGVVAIDMRGHGRSGGVTTVGLREVLDVAAAVQWARTLGYARVVTVGFSMGGAVVLREAGLALAGELPPGDAALAAVTGGVVDGVVSVSAPAFWYYRGTKVMRVVHRLVATRTGRLVMRMTGTRITSHEWTDPLPTPPHEAAAMLGATPLLVVHGDVDKYFPLEHARAIQRSAESSGVRTDLWVEAGFGHAESAVTPDLLDRIGNWARECPSREGG